MFRYYQTGEKSPWIPIADDEDVDSKALAAGAKKMTILAVSEVIDENTVNKTELAYKGPLYFDIDCKNDLGQAIESACMLVDRLVELNVPIELIEIVASGSKGLHVMVPQSLFSSGRKIQHLPAIYMEMAKELHVLGLDFQVYSGGRGVSWRIRNQQRYDDAYPVPLTSEELHSLTADTYKQIVASPREVPIVDCKGVSAPGLTTIYDRAKKALTNKPKNKIVVTDLQLEDIKEVPPPCMQELAEYHVKPALNYNEVAMQFASYVARSGVEESKWEPLASRMAESATSSQYDSLRKRHTHLLGVINYARANSQHTFACNAMRGVLKSRVCDECPINNPADSVADSGLELGIIEKDDGYYLMGEKSDRKISTFILEPIDVYLEDDQFSKSPIRMATDFEIRFEGKTVGTAHFPESSWTSKSAFLRELEGVGNLAFIGSDTDIQKIKHVVYREDREVGEITRVHTAGMHLQSIGDTEIRVYVEPNMSLNQMRVRDTHKLIGSLPAPPRISKVKVPTKGDPDVKYALQKLMRVNGKKEVSQILGWFCAVHLKMHFMKRWSQFPLLLLWGNAGSGKTVSASLFAWLNGCDYTLEDAPLNLSSITPFAITSYAAGTTTIPRLCDEYNKSKMTRKLYDHCGEIMKAAWGGQIIAKGTLGRSKTAGVVNAEVAEIPISGPLVVMSEQRPEMPALLQRSVDVMLTRETRKGCDEYFLDASEKRRDLARLGKAMVAEALCCSEEWVEDRMRENLEFVPREMDDRPKYSFQVLLTGLDFLNLTCKSIGIDVREDVGTLKTHLIDVLEENGHLMASLNARSEVDSILDDIGTMISLSDDGNKIGITRSKHYETVDDKLLLDIPMIHAMYKRFKGSLKETVVISSTSQFAILLKQEPYYAGEMFIEEMSTSRSMVKLNLPKMEDKGILISMFTG